VKGVRERTGEARGGIAPRQPARPRSTLGPRSGLDTGWELNGAVFTGRLGHKDIEVLFDRICRETASTTCSPRRGARRRRARSSASTARSVRSSSPGARSKTSSVPRPSSTAGWRALKATDPTQPSAWRRRPARFTAAEAGRPADASALRRAGRRRLDLPEDHHERRDLRRLAGDQLRQAPSRTQGRHPPPGAHAADLGRRGADQDGHRADMCRDIVPRQARPWGSRVEPLVQQLCAARRSRPRGPPAYAGRPVRPPGSRLEPGLPLGFEAQDQLIDPSRRGQDSTFRGHLILDETPADRCLELTVFVFAS
jgi:hypothetical protein